MNMKHPEAEKIRLYAEIGRLLRERRIAAGLTQAKLGAKLGISGNTLSKIEDGVQPVSVHALYRAAMVFDVSLDELVPVLTKDVVAA